MKQHTKLSPESRFRAVVLYDGYCVLCNWFVRFVLRLDKTGRIGFAHLDSAFAKRNHELIPPHGDTVVLMETDRILTQSRAVFRVIQIVGGAWKILLVFSLLPVAITDALYDVVARTRDRVFGRYEVCPMPEERYKERFIGDERRKTKD